MIISHSDNLHINAVEVKNAVEVLKVQRIDLESSKNSLDGVAEDLLSAWESELAQSVNEFFLEIIDDFSRSIADMDSFGATLDAGVDSFAELDAERATAVSELGV